MPGKGLNLRSPDKLAIHHSSLRSALGKINTLGKSKQVLFQINSFLPCVSLLPSLCLSVLFFQSLEAALHDLTGRDAQAPSGIYLPLPQCYIPSSHSGG